jgi:hypothetical protein
MAAVSASAVASTRIGGLAKCDSSLRPVGASVVYVVNSSYRAEVW